MIAPDNEAVNQMPIPVDVASPAGYVVSTISSFIKGTPAIPAPPQMIRDAPIRISLFRNCIAILKPVSPRIAMAATIFVTRACRLDRLKIIYFQNQ